ncbi:p53-induced death domain-containing protein 1-like [Branchiostoma floridae]|uniref:P53-induced death domain-containing protein 1-like n=1 Tax=Branchiostoma floridae TaxID=7739 RepID=A0A9J7HNW7_BRAFL|nr:p53-induced death domain-containing protein 1-like [Branchiostoma floridae]
MDRTRRSRTARTRRPANTGWTEAYLRAQMKENKLNLSGKSLNEIPPAVFRIEELEILDVSDNPLGSIPADIASLANLKEMRVAGCPITEISGTISGCKYLSIIDFSRNPSIATVTLPATMQQLRYLEYVVLCKCNLRSLPGNLTVLATVETLDLSTNALTTLPDNISGMRQLKILFLNNNAFERIPESIKSLGCLEILEMKKNKLKNRHRDLQLNVPRKLKILDMEDNSSLCFLPAGIEKLEHIEKLNLSYCGIETLPDSIGESSSLKEIHLAGNKLRKLPDGLGRLLNLETLDLEGNRRLYGLPPALHRLRKLKDKKIGTKTGLVLNDTPALQLPNRTIVKEGVVSVRTELLAEDCFNKVAVTIATEVVDDTIIEILSDDIVTIVDESMAEHLMLYMTDDAIAEEECAEDVWKSIFEDANMSLVTEISDETVGEETAVLDAKACPVMEELLEEIIKATLKSIALEEEEELRLGPTVPEEYGKLFSYEISTDTSTVQSLDLPAGCNLSIPPGATEEDTSVITVVLNPHGYDGTLDLEDTELLVSDIIEMRPSGMTFSEPVKLKIPHSLPKFDCEREYIVMTSEDDGGTWLALETLSEEENGQRFVTVEVTHFSSFAVVARPLKHGFRVRKGESSPLTSSEQTGIEINLPEDCIPEEQEISFTVTPVDRDTLACAGMEDAVDNMSHILNFFKGSDLLLNRPATVVLPLSPGEEDSQVRVLSCDENGDWEDVTSKVENVVLQGSKVAFQTDRLSSGFVVLRCRDGTDVSGIVNLVTRNVRARRVRTVIFKKWKEPREDGVMTARMECVLEESVDDRISRTQTEDKYELQEGTPTPPVAMLENETVCAIFHGNIRPDVEEVNGMYGVNFKFYCERTRRLEFDVKVLDLGEDLFSMVELYPGPRENYHTMSAWEMAEPATPLAVAGITTPRNQDVSIQPPEDSGRENESGESEESGREQNGEESEESGAVGGNGFNEQLNSNYPSVTVDSRLPIIDYEQLDFPGTSLIGQGAFGSVKKAFYRRWRQEVAVKSLTLEIYGTSEQELLYSEARKLNVGSRSDYVIRLLGICLQPQFAIVMPFMENGSLTDLLQNIDVPWALRYRMARETAMGMTFLHSQDPQIIHCDLKAENVLLDGDFHVKISDFGLSKWKMQSRIVTEKSPMGGTPTHVPPEFFDTDAGPTDKADVYSFGVLLWEIATRRRPYRDAQGRLNISTPLSCYVTGGGRPDMSLVPTDVPGVDTVNQLMQACWSQSPDDRPSFQECVDQLRDVNDLSSDEDVLEAIINVRREKKAVK